MTKDQFNGKVLEIKRKVKNKWNRFKDGVKDGIDWAKENPGEAAVIITAGATALAGAGKIAKNVDRRISEHRETNRRLTEKYDPVTGSWLKIKRPMTAREQVELAERRQNGESTTVILSSMGILKR
jgi:hypothetical protein